MIKSDADHVHDTDHALRNTREDGRIEGLELNFTPKKTKFTTKD